TPTVASVSDLSIAKSVVLTTDADGSTTISAGDTVTFSVTVTNGGPNNATGVGVGDTVPDGYTTIGSISNGGSESGGLISWSGLSITTTTPLVLTYTAVVTATGNYTNFAEITASDNFDPDSSPDATADTDTPSEDDETSATPTVASVSDLSIAKSVVLTTDADGSTTISAGDTVTFSVTVTNAGPNNATGVGVGDTVPDGYTTIGSISNGGSESGGLISWSGLSITTTTPLVLTYTAVVTATGNYTNFAEITASDNFDPDSSPDATADTDTPSEDDETSATPTVASVSDLSIAKSVVLTTDADGSTTISAGDTVTFSVTVTNAGPNNATGVGVGDTVPDGYTTIGSISNGGSESGGLISWSGLSVTTTTPLVLTYTAVVTATGNYTNFAEITASDNFDPDSSPDATADTDTPSEDDETSATPTVASVSDLSIAKSVVLTTDADGSTTISAGDTVTFSVTVTNGGPNNATGVGVGDTVPDGYTTIGSISNGGSESGGLISWSGLSITTTTPLVLTYTAVVTATGNYTNFAEITASDNFDPDSSPDATADTDTPSEDDETSATPEVPSLSVIKTVRVAGSALNDVIEYDIVVTNTGNVTLTDIEITDDNADAGSIVGSPIVSLAPGASVTVTANQTITQADIDAGFIENSATATGDSPSGTDDVIDVSDAGDETVETPNGDGTTDGEPDNDPTVTDLIADPSLSVIKTIRVAGSALNDVIEYDIVVTNTGNVTLTDIEITDDNADVGSIVGSP
ncbi:beta strand repeat-containing protein, partial [Aquimarina litoralis]|uniref:beta strand repeat-containing protein n=1 Tax=Aquimarina litoralis TaxID=584605 RepID=UPI003CD082DF